MMSFTTSAPAMRRSLMRHRMRHLWLRMIHHRTLLMHLRLRMVHLRTIHLRMRLYMRL
jgi:hypothetical protein